MKVADAVAIAGHEVHVCRYREARTLLRWLGPDLRGLRVLDVAGGDGYWAAQARRRGAWAVALDIADAKLRWGHQLAAPAALVRGDALELPFADASFDAATVGFGARNFSDLARGLQEMVRVVRPGGRVVVLEFTSPTHPPLSIFYSLWFDRVVPLLGRLAGDPDAYSYLPDSVKRFPAPVGLAQELERAGLREIGYLLTAGGIVVIHHGTVPPQGS
jgi:demethylmenaquinone methyltransferase / 2-methoxy-6-polyprenyl-1,4-benzoquinol methylase